MHIRGDTLSANSSYRIIIDNPEFTCKTGADRYRWRPWTNTAWGSAQLTKITRVWISCGDSVI